MDGLRLARDRGTSVAVVPSTTVARTAAKAMDHGSTRRLRPVWGACAGAGGSVVGRELPLINRSSATLASPMSRRRVFGSRSSRRWRDAFSRWRRGRQRVHRRRRPSGPMRASGNPVALEHRWPVSISYSTTPNAQTSAACRPPCPHLLGRHVRRRSENHAGGRRVGRERRRVRHGGRRARPPSPSKIFARPKSSSLTRPSGVTLTFAGLRSR